MSEMLLQIQIMNDILKSKRGRMQVMLYPIETFVNDTELQGRSYRTAKEYFQMIHIPLLRGLIRAMEEITESNQQFISRFYGQVDGSPFTKIDTDKLEELTTRALEINKIFMDAFTSVLPAQNGTPELASELIDINHMTNCIQRLYGFESGNMNLYQTARILLENVKKGLDHMNKGHWDVEMNAFISPKASNREWANALNKDWEVEKETSKVELYVNQFGMTKEQAQQLIEFEKRFEKYFDKVGWSQERKNLEFVKILASAQYGSRGGINQTLWEISAGVYNTDELMEQLQLIGYTKEDAAYFISDIIQKIYDSNQLNNDYVHLVGSLAVILNKSTLQQLGSTGSAPDSMLQGYYKELATQSGDIASGSLSREDIRADIDALVISEYLRVNPSQNIIDVTHEYYLNIESNKINRAEELLKIYGNGDIELGYQIMWQSAIYGSLTPGGYLLAWKDKNKDISDDVHQFLEHFNNELNGIKQ
ncbi:T7SS effector LXG polymorphic toxin [Carnobacterium gallinarum]|uniref:T7SS effector LXG polymorphic toxin n=1 Tax=Carnobacterium gallinarum TaxID=2749 RepID=UPI000A43E966|nr:T7SS effector LXG polymorphic toxin [Carnobacterium gallinarum]